MRDVGFLDVAVAGLQACVVDAAAFVVEPVDRFDFFAVIDEFDLGQAGGVARGLRVLPSPAQEVRARRGWRATGRGAGGRRRDDGTTPRTARDKGRQAGSGAGQDSACSGLLGQRSIHARARGSTARHGSGGRQGGDLGTVAQLLSP